MRKRDFIALFISIIALFISLALVFPYALNLEYVKSLIETHIYDRSGLEVRIVGGIDFALFPEQHIFADNVTVMNGGSKIASIEKAAVYLDVLSAVKEKKEIEGVDHIVLLHPVISVKRNEAGRLNIIPVVRAGAPKPFIKAGKVTLVNGSIAFSDLQAGHDLRLDGLNMVINDLDLDPAFPNKVSFSGKFEIDTIDTSMLALTAVSMGIKVENGLYEIEVLKAGVLGGSGKGAVSININGDRPIVSVRSDMTALNLERLSKAFNKDDLFKGNFDLSLDIMMQADRVEDAIKNAKGSFVLSGGSIILKGFNVDELLEKYRKTQTVGIMEIGAFLIAGPLGTVINSGFEYGGLYKAGIGVDGEIREFVSSWEIKDGVITARDAAFATEKNRLAMTGAMDLVNGTFEEFTVSVLDTDGCSEFTQKISGSFDSPQTEKEVLKKTLFGPAISIIKKAGKLLSGGKCEAFYMGAVQHPQ